MDKAQPGGMRIDELARRAGVATTTVRLYQNRGLLPGPRLVGRTGYYGETHLSRLALIGRLQQEGFSLTGIGRLIDAWEQGRDLEALVGLEHELDVLLHDRQAVVLEAPELLALFPSGSLNAELVQRAASLGLVEPLEGGRFRLPDRRFLDAGATLVRLGIPAATVLDEWAALVEATDAVAERFVSVFKDHLLPEDWRRDLTSDRAEELAAHLAELRRTARQTLVAAFDASVARVGARHLGELSRGVTPAAGG